MNKTSGTESLELEVADFGPIVRANIDFRPLTVFVGPSNTGKSYLATLIYALHRLFAVEDYRPAPMEFLWGFYVVRFLRTGKKLSDEAVAALRDFVDQTLSEITGERGASFPVPESIAAALRPILNIGEGAEQLDARRVLELLDAEAGLQGEVTARLREYLDSLPPEPAIKEGSFVPLPESVAALLRPFLDIGEAREPFDAQFMRCFGIKDTGRLVRHGGATQASVVLRRYVSADRTGDNAFEYSYRISGEGSHPEALASLGPPLRVKADRFLLSEVYAWLQHGLQQPRDSIHALRRLFDAVAPYAVGPLSRAAYYLPADRATAMRTLGPVADSMIQRSTYGMGSTEPALSGIMADFLQAPIRFDESRDGPRRYGIDLAKGLEAEILEGSVRLDRPSGGSFSLSYRPNGWKDDLALMNASSMVSELTPVVFYLRHVVRPGEVLIIEEPESHLHPEMQVAFTRQLAAAVRAGIRIIITTHSEWVLETLANLVRLSELPPEHRQGLEGDEFSLSPDEVGAWLFEPSEEPKGSVVREIPLDTESGVFPAGFGDVAESLYNRWVEIANRIEENGN